MHYEVNGELLLLFEIVCHLMHMLACFIIFHLQNLQIKLFAAAGLFSVGGGPLVAAATASSSTDNLYCCAYVLLVIWLHRVTFGLIRT